MMLRELTCDRHGCKNRIRETNENYGFPNWGHVGGLSDPETGADMAYICPYCKREIARWLNGDTDDLG